MSSSTEPIDPLAWICAERQVVSTFAATNAQAESDLSGSVAAFLTDIQAEQAAEAQFTDDLAAITLAVNPAVISQTLQDLSTSSAAVDTAFSTLQTAILMNNQAASNLVQQIAIVSPVAQQVAQNQSALDGKIASYQSALRTFRTFGSNKAAATTAAPPPPATA